MTRSINALIFVAILALPAWTLAQQTYKCGNGYSDTPCPGGVAVPNADARSAAQKAQAETAARRDSKLADGLEKDRLKAEAAAARDGAAKAPVAKMAPAPAEAASTAAGTHSKKKKHKEPEFFTAQVPGEGKARKSAAAKAEKAEKAEKKSKKKSA